MAVNNAYFAGGCFWCITPVFMDNGAIEVVSGYSGGNEVNPTYEAVKHQETGHRETINIVYDDEKISFEQLVDIFLMNVDPFDEGGQFIDRGHSYTLAVYYRNDREKEITLEALKRIEEKFHKKTAVAVEPFKSFYDAEEYHQNYYLKNPEAFERELKESGRKKSE